MDTLFEHLGEENLRKLVDTFYDFVFTSEKIGPLFKNDKEEKKRKQFYFLTQLLGGPQLYSLNYGHPRMRMRHMPHEITNAAKGEWLWCMRQAINSLDVTEEIKERLYSVFPQLAQHMVNS